MQVTVKTDDAEGTACKFQTERQLIYVKYAQKRLVRSAKVLLGIERGAWSGCDTTTRLMACE